MSVLHEKSPALQGWLWVGYSLHQLLRYMAAHSGWHLLLPVRGDSQRVPNEAEALGEWVMVPVLIPGLVVSGDHIAVHDRNKKVFTPQ